MDMFEYLLVVTNAHCLPVMWNTEAYFIRKSFFNLHVNCWYFIIKTKQKQNQQLTNGRLWNQSENCKGSWQKVKISPKILKLTFSNLITTFSQKHKTHMGGSQAFGFTVCHAKYASAILRTLLNEVSLLW